MPVKTTNKRTHHVAHPKERRSKKFLKVYAPYIPLLTILVTGVALFSHIQATSSSGVVKGYSSNTSESGLLESTNKARQTAGVSPLAYNSALDQAAQAKAEDMKAKNYWSHVSPDGTEPWIFIQTVNYTYSKAAENLAFGFASSDTVIDGWLNSPEHRSTLLDSELSEVGFGVVNVPDYLGNGPETVVVALYARPSDDVQSAETAPVQANSSKNLTAAQSLSDGKAPWSTFAIGLVSGFLAAYLLIKHARGVKKAIKRGERFVIRHPLLDITIIALLALAALATQTVGSIY